MGGYFSSRWNGVRTRQDTDPLQALDVRWLKRIGALQPGAIAFPSWTCRGEASGNIATEMSRSGETLTLVYTTTDWLGHKESIREPVWLDTTPCHLGGERTWFLCPGCYSRRAVIFCWGGRFRCRACHNLAYTSTREDAFERATRRCARIRKKLGETSSYGLSWEHVPRRPKGMHWYTYERRAWELLAAIDAGLAIFSDELRRLVARIDKTFTDESIAES
jgi:hypothetical protein